MRFLQFLLFPVATGGALLLSGCMAPGYPYTEGPALQTSMASGGYSPNQVMMQPVGSVPVLPYTYAPPQVIVAPTFYRGCGWGYWYGNRYWPYRPNCGFWGGSYYNGYRWNGCRTGVQGGPYGYYRGNYHGSYQGQSGWYR